MKQPGPAVGHPPPLGMVRSAVRYVALLLALLAGCAAPLQHPFPLNQPGRPADVAADVWGSTLLFTDGGMLCSAVLVGPDVALTARHCLQPGFKGGLLVHPDGRTFLVVEAVVAEDADLAFLRTVPESSELTAGIAPVTAGARGYVLGYGCSSGLRLEARPVVFVGRGPTKDPTDRVLDLWEGQACKGDSGGGIFVDGRLVGVTTRIDKDQTYVLSVPAEFVLQVL